MTSKSPHIVQMGQENSASVGSFTFLNEVDQLPIDPMLLDDLAQRQSLSKEEIGIVREIRASLSEHGRLPFPWTQQEDSFLNLRSQGQWLDYLIYRHRFVNFPKNKILTKFPIYILIEPMSVCNLRCVMCFQVDRSFTRKPFMGMMDLDMFKDVIDQGAAGGTKAITMASRGEPTLHPKLPEMLEYASGKFIEIKLTTNATRLSEPLCHSILSSGVNILVFSVDASTKQLYEEIRVRGDFDVVCENIERFHKIRKTHYPDANISTRISAVRFRSDQDPVAFKAFWSGKVDEIGMKDSQSRWDTYANDTDDSIVSPCHFLWERLYVWCDGTTNPCDLDYKSHLSTGNVRDKSIKDIWLGPDMMKMREAHRDGARKDYSPCDRCGMCFE